MNESARRFHREEMASTVTHAAGLLASLVGAVILISMAWRSELPLRLTSSLIYCGTLVLVYLSSTLYHAARHPGARTLLQVVDHCAVYLLIAGTYTPLCLLGLGGVAGWSICGFVWLLALFGVLLKLFFGGRMMLLSTATYLAMGWVGVLAARPFLHALSPEAVAYVVAGGLAYTAGTIFFASQRIPYAHALWHVFVLLGSALHYVAIASQVV
ncbi:MAG TPA: hemolysin III family protein [Candidatus Limnocylindrales bacterium]|nr:hemolysin III family protein [Candidatus Limnocylindrales bacterium]